jgi:hypothetical protein
MVELLNNLFDFSPISHRTLLFKRFTGFSILLLSLLTAVFTLPRSFQPDFGGIGLYLFLLLGPHFLFSAILITVLETGQSTMTSTRLAKVWRGTMVLPWLLIWVGCVAPGVMVPIIINWIFLGNMLGAILVIILVEFQH